MMSTSTPHLSFPTHTAPDEEPSAGPSSLPRVVLKNRLYIGNLHSTVDEYTLLRIFSRYGKITNLDYLFHKSGPSKGKPRGFAFVEYGDQQDALRALSTAHDKLLRGRKLVVTFAHQAPLDTDCNKDSASKIKKKFTDGSRSTALSLLKSAPSTGAERTKDKIAVLEAKLQQLEQSRIVSPSSTGNPATSLHPSLPSKPSQSLFSTAATPFKLKPSSNLVSISPNTTKPMDTLPSLPIPPKRSKGIISSVILKHSHSPGGSEQSPVTSQKVGASNLIGVRIKAKESVDLQTRSQNNRSSNVSEAVESSASRSDFRTV